MILHSLALDSVILPTDTLTRDSQWGPIHTLSCEKLPITIFRTFKIHHVTMVPTFLQNGQSEGLHPTRGLGPTQPALHGAIELLH